MKIKMQYWMKPAVTVSVLLLLTWLAPLAPIDPWNLLSPKKIFKMILALTIIQVLGSAMAHYLGARTGALLTGFFGGLISSTATTASLARRSSVVGKRLKIGEANKTGEAHQTREVHNSGLTLTFLSATGAMLIEGLALVIAGTTEVHYPTLVIFIGPILATLGMIFVEFKNLTDQNEGSQRTTFFILPLLKLSLFIVGILMISKIFQKFFGQNGLLVVTSLVSLFEIHGSVIANVQLHELGTVSVRFLCSLLAVSVVASYLSKLFLIWTLGSRELRSQALKRTLILFVSLGLSWALALHLSK